MVNDAWQEHQQPEDVEAAARRSARARRSGADRMPPRHRERSREGFVTMEPLLTRYVREPNCFTLDFYLQHEGYEGLRKALAQTPDQVVEHREGVGPARPRRRRVSDRDEVAVRRSEIDQAAVHRLQRRRERAGDVQRSPADGAEPAPAHRRLRDRVLRHRREGRLHLHPRRVLPRAARARARDRRSVRAGISREERPRLRASTARSTSIAARARTKRAKRRRCSNRSKGSARSRATSRRSPPSSGSTAARPPSTTSRRSRTCR